MVSKTPFIAPSARLTGPVEFPAEGEADIVVPKAKEKKKSRKIRKEDKTIKPRSSSPSAEKIREPKELSQSCPPAPAQATPGPGSVKQAKPKHVPVHTQASAYQPSQDYSTGQETSQPGSTGQDVPQAKPFSSGFSDFSITCAYRCSREWDSVEFDSPHSDTEYSDDQQESEEGEVSSDNLDKPELTEEMTYRETVRSIRSFMGWDHIPPFESDLSEPNKSNNLWKGKAPKHPARISLARRLAMPKT